MVDRKEKRGRLSFVPEGKIKPCVVCGGELALRIDTVSAADRASSPRDTVDGLRNQAIWYELGTGEVGKRKIKSTVILRHSFSLCSLVEAPAACLIVGKPNISLDVRVYL